MPKVYLIIVLGLVLRVVVAVWNGFWGPSFGADLDAMAFHDYAVQTARGESGDRDFLVGWVYAYLLGKVYTVFGESLFLGGLLSCIAWCMSSLVLVKIIKLLRIPRRSELFILGIYTLLPGSILLTAVTLREAYQMLFVNGILLSGLHLLYRVRLKYLAFFLLCAIGGGFLHTAIAAFAILSGLAIFFMSYIYAGHSKARMLSTMPIAGVLFLLILVTIGANMEGGLALAVATYREGTLVDARADYSRDVAISSLFDLFIQFPYLVLQYLFEPMPWKISSVMDIYVLAENLLRLCLLVRAVSVVRKDHANRPAFIFLLASYFLLESIWALGTNNWGTALRHHLIMLGCLLVLGFGGHRTKERRGSNLANNGSLAS